VNEGVVLALGGRKLQRPSMPAGTWENEPPILRKSSFEIIRLSRMFLQIIGSQSIQFRGIFLNYWVSEAGPSAGDRVKAH
jgi:hypothetical protein